MQEKIYVVTLHNREDLEGFYTDMESKGFHVSMKREISRNTHYLLTEDQAEELLKDSRVWDVKPADDLQIKRTSVINNESYTKSGNFWKSDTISPATVSVNDFQWGHLHCAGNELQRDKSRFGTTNGELNDSITGNYYGISSSNYTINGTTYPVRGILWVPTSVGNSVDIVVCYHGTLDDSDTTTILNAANTVMDVMIDNVNIKDKIIFSVAYPQDNISAARNINMVTPQQLSTFYFGDNIVYARAALLWAKNNLNSGLTSLGLSQQINRVFMFGHSQGGSVVHKLNTLETTDGVIANSPGPIRLDETCSVATGNLTCNKLSNAGFDPTTTPLSSNTYYQRSVANFVTGHKAKITYFQALDDPTGGPGLDGQIVWMSELMTDMENNNQDYEYIKVPTGGHASFASNLQLQGIFRNIVGSRGGSYEIKSDSVSIFNNGKHVDVVIVDDGVSYDCDEWNSPSSGNSRFVPYQWFNELNSTVTSIDDDNSTIVTGTITYPSNSTNADYHGTHVTGTAAGQHYGWAREANIYNLDVFNWGIPSLLIFDYLRAFHKNKPINPSTGKKNPTITNHSWSSVYYMPLKGYDGDDPIYRLDFSDITNISYNGVTYNSSNPGPSGWTESGVEKDFGVRFGLNSYPRYSAALAADVLDAVEDGIIVIGAAGNDNLNMVRPTDPEWNNTVFISGLGNIFYNRGGSPNTADSGSITVGNLSNFSDFRRAVSSMFGSGVDIFAPGTQILSSFNSSGLEDSKYGGDPNYFYPISGTSMASPQVAGVAACLATNKTRFTNDDVRKYLKENSIENDIVFNINGGDFDDPTCQKGSPNKYLHIRNPRKETGVIEEVHGLRKSSGQTFPRRRFT